MVLWDQGGTRAEGEAVFNFLTFWMLESFFFLMFLMFILRKRDRA